MTRLAKSRKLNRQSSDPLKDIAFDDDEPLREILSGESDEEDDSISAPPLTYGKDSTKPTAFDRLPWKEVKIPEFISDGISLEADGGMLGLEELDGSLWEVFKNSGSQKQKASIKLESPEVTSPKVLRNSESKINKTQSSSDTGADNVKSLENVVGKLARKMAKKERLAILRKLKKENAGSETGPKGSSKAVKRVDSEANDDTDLNGINWNAVAELEEFDYNDVDVDPIMNSYSFDHGLLPDWCNVNLSCPLKSALHFLSFNSPTPVQKASLEVSLSQSSPPRDLVVIAETGSGKTLAYGLPIINHLMSDRPDPAASAERLEALPIAALILTPTRELCLQVKNHLETFLKAMCFSGSCNAEINSAKNRSGISVVAICGGIAAVKQRKQLELSKKLLSSGKGGRGCIAVATPGRLWDLIQSWDSLAQAIRLNLDWLVIDEADRMVERGHFEELEKILKMTKRPRKEQGVEWKNDWGGHSVMKVKEDIRTMVFSATMDKNLQINLKKNWKVTKKAFENPIQGLIEHIDFRDENPELIDLTPKGKVVEGLKECKIECLLKDKDLYLFHFLLRYSGRTIVFLSSIAALRRLTPIITLLLPHYKTYPLHSEMKQRARLKSLERFRSASQSILLSTDVAARGLDIPFVNHVVHYQIPRTVDCYIHRSGRTARAGREGVALVLIAPDEIKTWRSLVKSLGRVDDLPSPPIMHSISQKLKDLLELARKIDAIEHKHNKEAHEDNWIKKAANMMEIDVDDSEYDSDGGEKTTKQQPRASNALSRQLRSQLQEKLSDPIISGGVVVKQSKKRDRSVGNCYITDPAIMEKLLKGESHDKVLGLDKHVEAFKEIDQAKRKRNL
ncbi:P-loop containing nucleoside triphosphate hydrolase protein [Phakopsora pachyrhizi]|uniref:ATP-dependent RNA helicase n=1 Tax=Phakopsora pachyrhizi TaxID=170000 RepID=A0AAV0B6U4_PHAPC|nr:P-loop containing nucleoside triphosphate hydrolase protein [Phakopsora pachyrhizi]CAH7681038.1 P-loop containing nucleoside triphosphate hydrolase protein [Phakopsora pachyrhizi]